MNKTIFALCLLCLFSCCAFSMTPSLLKISGIEKQLFGYEYKNDSEINRINRIEKYLYGKTFSNVTDKRLNKIALDIGYIEPEKTANKAQSSEKISTASIPSYEKEDPTVQYPIVDKIETKVFNKSFNGENIYSRVSKLENKVFGKTSSDNLSNRVNKLRLSVLDPVSSDDFVTGAAIPTENYYDSISSMYDDDVAETYGKTSSSKRQNNSFSNNYSSQPSQSSVRNNLLSSELTTIEQTMFNQSFSNESIESRLSRVESQVFKRNFANDNPAARLQRIAAVKTAQKSSKLYDNNKLMRNLSTGMQVGTFLLMILAMIL